MGFGVGYVCYKELGELGDGIDGLEELQKTMEELGFCPKAARDTGTLVGMIRKHVCDADPLRKSLACVWHAIEWWQMGLMDETEVLSVCTQYEET